MTHPFAARAFAALALLVAATVAPAARADDGAFAGLSGAWVGEGTVTKKDGGRERIRCRATYSVPPSGKQLNQGLTCASDSFKLDVKSNVFLSEGGSLKGTWTESSNQVAGSVVGQLSGGVISTSVEASGFRAKLTVRTQGAKQSVSISPQGTEVQSVQIEMRRS